MELQHPGKLLVFSNPTARVPHFDTLGAQDQIRRFIGWTTDMSRGIYNKDEKRHQGVHTLKEAPEEILATKEYKKLVRDGDLIPADKETANVCGVTWHGNCITTIVSE